MLLEELRELAEAREIGLDEGSGPLLPTRLQVASLVSDIFEIVDDRRLSAGRSHEGANVDDYNDLVDRTSVEGSKAKQQRREYEF